MKLDMQKISTLPELAVAWTLAWPAVDGAIVGARRPDQLDDWIGAGSVELDAEWLRSAEGVRFLSGKEIAPGSRPIAAS